MKKTITIEEALTFLNLCVSTDPRNTTALVNNFDVAVAIYKLFNEDGDKIDSIQINRSKTGLVIGFAETEKPKEKPKVGKKTVADPRPKIFKAKDDKKKVSK